jgi:glycosyltransferase involved in cell wall biosynthesis
MPTQLAQTRAAADNTQESSRGKSVKYLSWIPGECFGGCESYALRIAKRAMARGMSVTVVCVGEACAEAIRESGRALRVIKLGSPRLARHLRLGYRLERVLKVLSYIRCLVSERPDVVHAVLPWHAHSLGWIKVCTLLRIRLMITFQLVAPAWPPDLKYVRALRKAKQCGARLSTVSEQNRRLLCDYYGFEADEVAVINNRPQIAKASSLDREQRRQTRHELGVSDDATMILTVGGFREQKGHDLIIAAIPEIAEGNPKARFVWAGEGQLRSHLNEMATQCGVVDKIRMLGHRADVARLLNAADLFLFPSRHEGESFALCEAAMAGLPIVASDASGIPDLLRDGEDAYLFRSGDARGLARAVRQALADPTMAVQRGLSAKERVSSYSEEEMFRDTFTLLRTLH